MSREDTEPYVEGRFFAAAPSRSREPFAIRIGPPREHSEGDFVCAVSLSHKRKPFLVSGVDALQALSLCFTYIDAEVERLGELGWSFYHDETDPEPFDPRRVYFPVRFADPA